MPPRVSLEEYFRLEAHAPDGRRYEFYDGEVVAMAGASPAHNDISTNMVMAVQGRLPDGNCRARSSDQRVFIPAQNGYVYPDVVVACEPRQYQPGTNPLALLNPVVVVEILSNSTEARDRGRKMHAYQAIPSLRHYLMVDSERVAIDFFSREGESSLWSVRFFDQLTDVLLLTALNVELPVAEVYNAIRFGEGID